MGAPTGNWRHDSARELTEMASIQFAFYGRMNPYTYQRLKITPLPNETGLTVPGGTGVAVVQGWAQQALPGGGSSIECEFKVYECLKQILDNDEIIACEALKEYLQEKWYQIHRECAWYDSHKSSKNEYYGYWSFEARCYC